LKNNNPSARINGIGLRKIRAEKLAAARTATAMTG